MRLEYRRRRAVSLCLGIFLFSFCVGKVSAQPLTNAKHGGQPDAFRQLEEWLPTPNYYRTASGEPGPGYWQQEADYEIDITIDDEKQRLIGSETIAYHNFAPVPLKYIWVQLDQNIFSPKLSKNTA